MTEQRKRLVLDEIRIDWTSMVNSPAQEGAVKVMMKRADGPQVPSDNDSPVDETMAAATPTNTGKGSMSEQNSTTDELVKRLERAEAVLNFTANERTHFDGLAAEAQDEFIGKAAADRSADVALAKRQAEDADPVVYITMDGLELRKGADGDALIAAMRSNDMIRKDNALLKADSDRQRIAKRVREELPHISGTEDEQVALVKAIEAIGDEATRDGAFAILKRNDQGLSSIMKTNGSQGGSVEKSANQTLNEKVAKYAADEKISFTKAYAAVMDTSEGNDLYEQMKIEKPVLPGNTGA